MDQPELNSLRQLLSSRRQLVAGLLIFVPLAFRLGQEYSLGLTALLLGGLILLFCLLAIMRQRPASFSGLAFWLIWLLQLLALAGVIYLLGQPLSPLIFLAVALTSMATFAYKRSGFFISTLFGLIAMVTIFLLNSQTVSWESFAELLAYLGVFLLLNLLTSDLVELDKTQLVSRTITGKNLEVEHQRLLSLINNIGDAVIATDEDGNIQTYNGAALDLINTNVSIEGKALDSVWKLVDDEGRTVNLITEAKTADRTIRRSDIKIIYGQDDFANLYTNVTPIKLGQGDRTEKGFTLILQDITKQKSLEEERDEFVAVVSHELRTPVTITEGKVSNAQLLLSKADSPPAKVVEALGQAHSQVVYLADLINDLASLARAERTDVSSQLESINPSVLVADTIKSYEIEAKGKGLELKYEKPMVEPHIIYNNRLYIQEILQNFLTNALKYTKQGQITITLLNEGTDKVRIGVTDQGIGISTSDQKRLFEKFFRSEDYRTRESSGTGLGLYVTAKLASKVDGKIDVKSQLNAGSTFSLTVGSKSETDRPTAASA